VRFELLLTPQAEEDAAALTPSERRKAEAALDRMRDDLLDPVLASKRCESVFGPGGAEMWSSLVQPDDPDGLQIWWWFGPGDRQITVLAVTPHRSGG
jgi:hypothetical protein